MAAVDPVVASLQDKFDSAGEVSDVRPNEAVALYQSILAAGNVRLFYRIDYRNP